MEIEAEFVADIVALAKSQVLQPRPLL